MQPITRWLARPTTAGFEVDLYFDRFGYSPDAVPMRVEIRRGRADLSWRDDKFDVAAGDIFEAMAAIGAPRGSVI